MAHKLPKALLISAQNGISLSVYKLSLAWLDMRMQVMHYNLSSRDGSSILVSKGSSLGLDYRLFRGLLSEIRYNATLKQQYPTIWVF